MGSFTPPPGSLITVRQTPKGFELTLRYPTGCVAARIFPAAFLAFWLCGWAVGEVMVTWILLTQFLTLPVPVTLFLLVWLTFWTFGGFAAVATFLTLVSPGKPERLSFEDYQLVHEKPAHLIFRVFSLFYRMQEKPFDRPELAMTREQIEAVDIETRKHRQHLLITIPDGRREVGYLMSPAEKAWILGLIREWTQVKETNSL